MADTREYYFPLDKDRPSWRRRMSDPGTTYRTREEVQRMRSTQDPIRGLQRYIEEWGLASEQDLKVSLILFSHSFHSRPYHFSNLIRQPKPRLIRP